MIGDLLSTLAQAQKLDISQIQKSIQSGTLPAYVGVPLLQQKMQQRKEAEALLAGQKQQGQPPIAQQVMQEASQVSAPQQMPQGIQALQQAPQQMAQAPAPQQGIDAAESNLPQEYAGGGIIAFGDPELNPNEDQLVQDNGPGGSWGNAIAEWWKSHTMGTPEALERQGTLTPAQAQAATEKQTNIAKQVESGRQKYFAGDLDKPKATMPEGEPTFPEPVIHRGKGSGSSGASIDAAAPAAPKTDTSGIEKLLAKYGDMITGSGKNDERDREVAGWTALANLGLGWAGGSSLYPMQNLGNAGIGALKGYTESMKDIKSGEDKRLGQLMALGLKGEELKMAAKKIGIDEAELAAKVPVLNAQAALYRAKASLGGGTAAQRVGSVGAKDALALKREYQNLSINPKSDPAFYSSLPKNVQDLLRASPGTQSYQTGLAEVKKIANQRFAEDIQYLKLMSSKSPDTITSAASDI